MEKTGSKNSYLIILQDINMLWEKQTKTVHYKNREEEYKKLSTEIINTEKTKDIGAILNLERTILRSELSRCPNDESYKGTVTSLSTAISELDLAYDAYMMLSTDTKTYKKATDTLISKRDIDRTKEGVPRDAFHRFIDSHKTRLGNQIISPDASPMRHISIINSRKAMQTCKQEYIQQQANALKIVLPDKTKERER